MKKIAFVVQRYGLEVNGGAELHCRILAEQLAPFYQIEVLTSCAVDYLSWSNVYPEGQSELNGITVRRFPVKQERNKKKVHKLERILRKRTLGDKLGRYFGITNQVNKWFKQDHIEHDSYEWSKNQGPYTPTLVSYIRDNVDNYEAFIFFTYLYFPTRYGLVEAAEKSILVPTAHDEAPIYLPSFKSFFHVPKGILYNTIAEKKFVTGLFNNNEIKSDIVGLGVSEIVRQPLTAQEAETVNIGDPYILYIGRIDYAKGCARLFEEFLAYKKSTTNTLKLVLVGQAFMPVPSDDSIISMGFVSVAVKQALLEAARALVIPSLYESLSLVTLESMQAGVPVIANQACEVLKDHIELSKAGFLYTDFKSFTAVLDIVSNPETDLVHMSANGKAYVDMNYNWEVVLSKVKAMINYVAG